MSRNLKNYDKYLQKIELYAQALQIEIVRGKHADDAAYIPSHRKIRIDEDLDEDIEIAALLHELGHVDDGALHNCDELEEAYGNVYKKTITKRQLKLILDCEKRAWDYGRIIAKKLRIPLGKWYDKDEKLSLETYLKNEGDE